MEGDDGRGSSGNLGTGVYLVKEPDRPSVFNVWLVNEADRPLFTGIDGFVIERDDSFEDLAGEDDFGSDPSSGIESPFLLDDIRDIS
jgi:hypothetical protein